MYLTVTTSSLPDMILHCQVNDDATRARMRKAFDEMDQDGSGALSPEELKVMLYRAGYNASDKMMQVSTVPPFSNRNKMCKENMF